MSVSIPTSFDIDLGGTVDLGGSIGTVGPITVAGIPTSFGISGIPDSFGISSLPTIELGTINLGAITLNPITLNPITLSPSGTFDIALTQIPSVRAHLPSTYCVGLCIFGIEVFALRFCGESQIITEPYVPNPCERCVPLPVTRPVGVVDNPSGANQVPEPNP